MISSSMLKIPLKLTLIDGEFKENKDVSETITESDFNMLVLSLFSKKFIILSDPISYSPSIKNLILQGRQLLFSITSKDFICINT